MNTPQDAPEQQAYADSPGAARSDVPDGGHGWIVLSACAVLAWWFVGINYTWGVLQASFVENGMAPASTLSFVGSLAMAWAPVLAIANAKMIRLIGLGEIAASFATRSVPGLFICIGCITGVGAR